MTWQKAAVPQWKGGTRPNLTNNENNLPIKYLTALFMKQNILYHTCDIFCNTVREIVLFWKCFTILKEMFLSIKGTSEWVQINLYNLLQTI